MNVNQYSYVKLSHNKKTTGYQIHRLVAMAFLPNPENKPEVDHIDSDITNNKLCNLRWATHIENMANENTKNKKKLLKESQKNIENVKVIL